MGLRVGRRGPFLDVAEQKLLDASGSYFEPISRPSVPGAPSLRPSASSAFQGHKLLASPSLPRTCQHLSRCALCRVLASIPKVRWFMIKSGVCETPAGSASKPGLSFVFYHGKDVFPERQGIPRHTFELPGRSAVFDWFSGPHLLISIAAVFF